MQETLNNPKEIVEQRVVLDQTTSRLKLAEIPSPSELSKPYEITLPPAIKIKCRIINSC